MEKIFNKLVRDNIPDIIKGHNEVSYTRTLNDREYYIELQKKLQEEYTEVVAANDTKSLLEELADMYEVICAMAKYKESSIEEIEQIATLKRQKRGGFEKRIFLEKTNDK